MSSDETLIRPSGQSGASAIPGIALLAVLGRGGMAIVYEGADQGFSPPRRVAVKLMSEEISADPEFRARFEHEASLVAGFRHDNIVRVYASGELSGTKYIIMEYLPGGTLAQRIERGGPLPPLEVARAGAQLADALAYAHDQGIVHRDFKPGNVLFTADGKPILSDFGVAKSVQAGDAGFTRHTSVIGAPRYMAPEQERGDPVSDRADVYSFGLTLYEMLTAGPPPTRERFLHTPEEGVGIKEKLSTLSPTLAALICQCLLSNPENRPSAMECARQLSAATLTPVAPQSDRKKTWVRWGVVAGALIVIAAAASVILMRQPNQPQAAQQSVPAGAPATGANPAFTAVRTEAPGGTANTAGDVPRASSSSEITQSCGPGAPESLLPAAVSKGLRAKVQLTLGVDLNMQRDAESTLRREVACLTSLARSGYTSPDANDLLREADGLLKRSAQ